MLSERNYMQTPGRNFETGKKCLFSLIMANIIVYVFAQILPGLNNLFDFNSTWFGEPWRLVTALFMHAEIGSADGIFHIFFNMFALYVFGSLSAPLLGGKSFLGLYLVSGVAGNLCWYFAYPDSPSGLVGASGSVMGIIIATAMLAPNTPMSVMFFPYPVKLKTLAVVFILIELANSFFLSAFSNVAYMAHVGGFVGGALYMEILHRRMLLWDPLVFLLPKKSPYVRQAPTPPAGWTVRDYHGNDGRVSTEELNRILDKISRTGINSLTPDEEETLRKAREQMMKR